MFRIVCVLIGYVFGCIQTAYITGQIMARIDIREHGSGNAGTSNVIRVLGRSAGLIVFVVDCLKTIAAYTVASLICSGSGSFMHPEAAGVVSVLPGLYAGLGAVLGHNFPFFLKFKGGKGIAASLGLLLVLDWRAALVVYAAGVIVIAASRFISLGSLVMTLLIPVTWFLFGHTAETVVIGVVLAAMAWYLHRGNIKRLLNGTERKFTFGRDRAKSANL